MSNSEDYRRGRHCVSKLYAHLVFVTKYRRGVFQKIHLEKLKTIFSDVCEQFEAKLVEFNGEDDHVHLLVEYPPKVAVSKLVNSLKGVSSRKLRQEFNLKTHKSHLWSPSYFVVSAGGAPLTVLKQYIESQRTPDS